MALVLWIEHSLDLPVRLGHVQPLPTLEDGGHRVGGVGHLDTLQEPAGGRARVVVLHSDPEQLAHVQHLQNEAVRVAALEKVPELLPKLPLARVPVDAVYGDEDVGVGAGLLHVPGHDDDFVPDGHQVAHLARKALDGLVGLKRLELVLLSRQGNPRITVEEIPVKKM